MLLSWFSLSMRAALTPHIAAARGPCEPASLKLSQAHRLTETPARLKGVAVLPMSGRDVRAGEQQPLTVAAPVLGEILQETLRNFLVVRVVTEPRGHQRKPLHEHRAIFAAVDIGFGPGYRCRWVERCKRRLQPFDNLASAHPVGAAWRTDRVRFEPPAVSLVPRGLIDHRSCDVEQFEPLRVLEIVVEPAECVAILVGVLRHREVARALGLQDDLSTGQLDRVDDAAR